MGLESLSISTSSGLAAGLVSSVRMMELASNLNLDYNGLKHFRSSVKALLPDLLEREVMIPGGDVCCIQERA